MSGRSRESDRAEPEQNLPIGVGMRHSLRLAARCDDDYGLRGSRDCRSRSSAAATSGWGQP